MIRAAGRAGRCPISAAAFIARGDTTRRRRWEWCLFGVLSLPRQKRRRSLRSSERVSQLLAIEDYRWAIAKPMSSSIFRLFFKIERHDLGDSLRGEGAAGAEGVKRLLSHSSEFNREYVTVRCRGRSGTTLCCFSLSLSSSLFLSREVARPLSATSVQVPLLISRHCHCCSSWSSIARR